MVANSIVWGNSFQIQSAGEVTYCDVQDGFPGVGNINADPLFVAPGANDYRLLLESPCIDRGDPGFVAQPGETDLDGNKRVWDGDGDGKRIVDMGAYEFGSHRYGDLNCDGKVTFDDIDPFVLVLEGTPPNYPEYYAKFPGCDHLLGDCNGDGKVTFDDIDPFIVLLGG